MTVHSKTAQEALAAHFTDQPLERLASIAREFPGHMSIDVQRGLDRLFSKEGIRFSGLCDKNHTVRRVRRFLEP